MVFCVVRGASRRRSPFRLFTTEGEVRLRIGEHILGRGLHCDTVLDDSQVSRQHARLQVTSDQVTVIDLDSINGSFLNGRRIRRPREMKPGDNLRLGNSVVELGRDDELSEERNVDSIRPLEVGLSPLGEEDIPTRRAEGLDVVGKGAELAYAQGQPDRAERFLAGYLASVLSEIEAGRPLPDPTVLEALRLSLRLADKTRKAAWFDYAVRLLQAHRVLPPDDQLEQMGALMESLPINAQLLIDYEAAMQRGSSTLSDTGLLILQKLSAMVEAWRSQQTK